MNNLEVELVSIQPDHFDEYLSIRSEPHNLYWTGYDVAPSPESFKKWFMSRISDPDKNIFLLQRGSVFVGSLNIDFYEGRAAIGYSTKQGYEGKGYGTHLVKLAIELVKKSGRDTKYIHAWISEKNLGSLKVITKSGFVKTGYEMRKRFENLEKYFEYSYPLE